MTRIGCTDGPPLNTVFDRDRQPVLFTLARLLHDAWHGDYGISQGEIEEALECRFGTLPPVAPLLKKVETAYEAHGWTVVRASGLPVEWHLRRLA